MRRLALVLCALRVCSAAFGAEGYVSEPAGFVRVELASNSSALVSMPFEPFDSSLPNVFSNQLLGASNEAAADRILQWDAAAQQYVASFKADGTGDTNRDGRWFTTNWVVSTQVLSVGEGFWVENAHGPQDVYLAGAVPLAATQEVAFVEGLNLFGYPFPSKIALIGSDLLNDGAWGATNAAGADQVQDSSGNMFWLLDQDGHTNDGLWLDEWGGVSSLDLGMGVGCWYDRILTNALWWSEGRPYSNPFDVGTGAPQFVSFSPGTNHDSVLLSLVCSGATGEMIEVLYQDISPTGCFVAEMGWAVADEGLSTSGGTAFAWTDAGGSGRPAVTSVFCRVYLLGRQDIDTDGDGLSDAREVFVHQTDQADSDTDDDAIGDGAEIQRGTSPTNSGSANVTLYANHDVGSNVYDGLSSVVTNGHGPKLNIGSAVEAAYSGDVIEAAAGAYEESTFMLGAKSVVLRPMGAVVVK